MYTLKLNNTTVQSPSTVDLSIKQIKIEPDTVCLNGDTVVGFCKYKRSYKLGWTDVEASKLNIILSKLMTDTVSLNAYDPVTNDTITATCSLVGDVTTGIKVWRANKHYYGKVEAVLEEVSAI